MMLKTSITGQQFQEAEVEAKIDRVSYNVTAYPAEFMNSDI